MSDVVPTYERLAQDILYRLQVCFPEYRLSCELWEQATGTFVSFHLSSDGRDDWDELIPDRDGSERRVRLQSYHLQTPIPRVVDETQGAALQHFRQYTFDTFVRGWFAERLRRAGLEA